MRISADDFKTHPPLQGHHWIPGDPPDPVVKRQRTPACYNEMAQIVLSQVTLRQIQWDQSQKASRRSRSGRFERQIVDQNMLDAAPELPGYGAFEMSRGNWEAPDPSGSPSISQDPTAGALWTAQSSRIPHQPGPSIMTQAWGARTSC